MERQTHSRNLRAATELLIEAAREWTDDRAIRLGAGLAYYSLFTLVPVMALAVGLASVFFGQQAVDREIYAAISDVVGEDVADLLIEAIGRVRSDRSDTALSLVSVGALLFSATLLFVAWREIVDIIWRVPRKRGFRAAMRRRGFGLAAVLGAGVLLTLLLLVQTLVGAVAGTSRPGLLSPLWALAGAAGTAALGAAFLAILFKFSPEIEVKWADVWLSAVLTMVLLSLSAHGYGWYVETVGLRSAAGVAGTLFLGLVFVYLAGQILLYGVELVKVSTSRGTATMARSRV